MTGCIDCKIKFKSGSPLDILLSSCPICNKMLYTLAGNDWEDYKEVTICIKKLLEYK